MANLRFLNRLLLRNSSIETGGTALNETCMVQTETETEQISTRCVEAHGDVAEMTLIAESHSTPLFNPNDLPYSSLLLLLFSWPTHWLLYESIGLPMEKPSMAYRSSQCAEKSNCLLRTLGVPLVGVIIDSEGDFGLSLYDDTESISFYKKVILWNFFTSALGYYDPPVCLR